MNNLIYYPSRSLPISFVEIGYSHSSTFWTNLNQLQLLNKNSLFCIKLIFRRININRSRKVNREIILMKLILKLVNLLKKLFMRYCALRISRKVINNSTKPPALQPLINLGEKSRSIS